MYADVYTCIDILIQMHQPLQPRAKHKNIRNPAHLKLAGTEGVDDGIPSIDPRTANGTSIAFWFLHLKLPGS